MSHLAVGNTVRTFHNFSPNGPWATVTGECNFPIAASRTFDGDQAELSTVLNSGPTPKFLPELVEEYEAKGFKWNMTYGERELERPEVLEIFQHAAVAVNFQWTLDAFSAQIKGQPTVIPPCTDMTMKFTPRIGYITLRPVFHVVEYRMDISGVMNKWVYDTQQQVYNSWRNWGAEWMEIFANAYVINGMAELLTDGPDGLEPTVEGVVDYYYERLPQCP
jgi:hypothetical protein